MRSATAEAIDKLKFVGLRSFSMRRVRAATALLILVSIVFSGGGCFFNYGGEPYYGTVRIPRTQEFRWSNGGLPRTFDPAFAAAPPEIDVVRALYEGLTDYDPKTLDPVPAVAAGWESSDDAREWTFYLRKDARWSNGKPVTAHDFERSWKRTLDLHDRAPHVKLFTNIVGATVSDASLSPLAAASHQTNDRNAGHSEGNDQESTTRQSGEFGVQALSEHVLRIRLVHPDRNFPALVAHPIFRPVPEGNEEAQDSDHGDVISNGAFKLSSSSEKELVLERATDYWDASTVNLERVRFVAVGDAEEALEAYRSGEIDAVTNAGFEPLALKLLTPYRDFRRATFGALTYYSFNLTRAPFNDVRVREALAIVIDRRRISEDQLGGATEPAETFFPTQTEEASAEVDALPPITRDIDRAKELLAEAGYPDGRDFPKIRLLINRNEQQRRVAQSVASGWRNFLGIETEIILKNWDEYEAAIKAGDYDVVRRGLFMQTPDEVTNLRIMFEQTLQPTNQKQLTQSLSPTPEQGKNALAEDLNGKSDLKTSAEKTIANAMLSERNALKEMPAIPIYFASSYSLVKPYVAGFDSNLLDAPSLKKVKIDTAWRSTPSRNSTVAR